MSIDVQSKMKFQTVEEYLAAIPDGMKEGIQKIRQIITSACPADAEEVISYNMPGFRWNGMLVWYAACKDHIGFYPSSEPIVVFKEELAKYKTSKGAIQFPPDKPLPVALIKKIVKFRVDDNREKAKLKADKKKKNNKG